jgi:hypothetical protein
MPGHLYRMVNPKRDRTCRYRAITGLRSFLRPNVNTTNNAKRAILHAEHQIRRGVRSLVTVLFDADLPYSPLLPKFALLIGDHDPIIPQSLHAIHVAIAIAPDD